MRKGEIRQGEIRKLTWAAFKCETWVLTLPACSAETRRPRHIPLRRELPAIIERRLAARMAHPECPHIFSRAGKPVVQFRMARGKACRQAGVRGWLFERYHIHTDKELGGALHAASNSVATPPADPRHPPPPT